MSSVPIQNFSVPAGTDQQVTIVVETTIENDSLEGCTIYWRVYEQTYGVVDQEVDPLIEKSSLGGGGIEITDPPTDMTLVVTLTPEDTVSLLRNYYHETTVVGEIGEQDTVVVGIMTVTQTENRIT